MRKLLTPRQQAFVNEYMVDLNATQAAIRAGYSVKTAEAQATRLLRNVDVRNAIQERQPLTDELVRVTYQVTMEDG